MITTDFITELFCRVDDQTRDILKHPQAQLYPSELVTLGLLFALKGVGNRAFYRWLRRDLGGLFPHLPEAHGCCACSSHGSHTMILHELMAVVVIGSV